jgi:hypothetical protein
MNDWINRIEAKSYHESEINVKISKMRQKLKNNPDSNQGQLVRLFKVEKIDLPDKACKTK